MWMNRRRLLSVSFAVAALSLAGCSSEARDAIEDDTRSAVSDAARDAAEVTARNLATNQGGEAFADAGHPISGELSCQAVVEGALSEVAVTCTGMTAAGGAAVLSGRTSELPGRSVVELNGSFVGTVDGAEVFSTDQLGG